LAEWAHLLSTAQQQAARSSLAFVTTDPATKELAVKHKRVELLLVVYKGQSGDVEQQVSKKPVSLVKLRQVPDMFCS
jgi:hypothetical protein